MKNRILFLLCLFVAVAIVGCNSSKKTKTVVQPTEEVKPKALVPWKQSNDPYVQPGDPINFYNQFAIEINFKVTKTVKVLQDGDFYPVDSSKTLHIFIPEGTRGDLINVDRNNPRSEAASVTIHFKEVKMDNEDASFDETNYHDFTFNLLRRDDTYTVNGTIDVVCEGKHYPAPVSIHGDGSKLCRLMCNDYAVDHSKIIQKQAEDVSPTLGTKVIKK